MSTDARTASPSPLSNKASLIPDEAALKRVFDAEFEASIASAKSQLADAPNLAPRVVESAFGTVWAQRGTIATNDQLKAVLAEQIRHSAARALSRRNAAGRMSGGKHGTGTHATASAAQADVWANIQKSLKSPETSTGTHQTAGHVRFSEEKRGAWVVPVVGLVAAAVLATAGVMYVSRRGVDDATLAAVSSTTIQPLVTTSPGQFGPFTINDSTKVTLGPESKIFIPDGFPTKIRAIRIEGSAMFEVAPQTATVTLPFRVVGRKTHAIATGTVFGISAYPNDSAVYVRVKQGSVTMKSGKSQMIVSANQVAVSEAGTVRDATQDPKAGIINWVDNRITVPKTTLRDMLVQLNRWFSAEVKVLDTPLLDREASFDVPANRTNPDSLTAARKAAIAQVEQSANVKYTAEGQAWVFRDNTGAKAAPAPAKPAGKKK